MKKVISGHVCNTETAKKVGSNQSETLYVTRAGVYFICSNTGDISTLSKDDAQRWTESYATDAIKHFASENNNLKSLRRAAGLTQRQLADAAGIFVTQVQKLESGEAKIENLRWHTVLSLSDALGVSTDKLCSSAKTPEALTVVSTFPDFLKYSGLTQNRIKEDWKIPSKEMRKWIDDETSIPAWVIPMLIELYGVGDRVEYYPIGSAIII